MYFPTSTDVKLADGEVRAAEPGVMPPSVLSIPSATAPNAPTLVFDCAFTQELTHSAEAAMNRLEQMVVRSRAAK
jgi:hypothetical protein